MDFGKLTLAGLALGGAYALFPGGRSDPGVALAAPAPTAIARIGAERRVVEGTGLGSLTIRGLGADGRALLVGVKRAGDPRMARCRVLVTPAPASTSTGSRAAIDCAQERVADPAMRRLGAQVLGIVVAEHVDAAAADRPYDAGRVSERLMAAVVSNGPALAAALSSPAR